MRPGFPVSFILAYSAWLFFNLSTSIQVLLLGLPVALLASAVSSTYLFRELKWSHFSPKRLVMFVIYAIDFAIALAKANIFMIRIILFQKPVLKPALLRIPLRTSSEFVTAGVANSITLTPGTLTVDAEDNFLYVHWIVASELEADKAKKEIVGNFEKNLKGVFE